MGSTNQSHDPRSYLDKVISLVKTRTGSVLARNTILKMDHFSSGTNNKLDFHLQGAPNFRVAELGVYGVAQPTVVGLSTILALLNSHPDSKTKSSCTWFSTREEPLVYINGCPYVLRDYADPLQNMVAFQGINAARLEKVEERLTEDVRKEVRKLGGLLLVHQELPDSTIVPCYIAADKVQTPREVFDEFQKEGYRVQYYRIPISPEQGPEDNYFDEYVRVIKTVDPKDPLIFNCGMGNVRTTVGIVIAQIIRRAQLYQREKKDYIPIPGYTFSDSEDGEVSRFSPDLVMEEVDTANAQDDALLHLVCILEKGFNVKMTSGSVIEWALGQRRSVEKLKEAIMGNYRCIVSLTSVLENGTYSKKLLDKVIDRSAALVNLREDILLNRVQQTAQSTSDKPVFLDKALSGLQRYFFLLCFTEYINESPKDTTFDHRFSSWVKQRTEVWTMLQHLRRKGPQLYLFRPVDDLRELTGTRHSMFEMTGAGEQEGHIPGEVEEFIIRARTGVVLTPQTILKVDFWQDSYPSKADMQEQHHRFVTNGATHFRQIQGTHVYGVAQPTVIGIRTVLRELWETARPRNEKIMWINLREEPIIYINNIPYVLRDRYFTLRNIRVYKGITGARLEQLEERLKEDIINEIKDNNGQILLHGEDAYGNVQASVEEVDENDIRTVREVMKMEAYQVYQEMTNGDEYPEYTEETVNEYLTYYRVPITAEKCPEWNDFDELRQLITRSDLSNTAIMMNCQIGLGRSTLGTVIATLLTQWLRSSQEITISSPDPKQRPNYQIINSLLRVIRNGLEVKRTVDSAIDQCSKFLNLREVIESAHIQMENEKDDEKRRRILKRGIVVLERYFLLICFQAYLDDTPPAIMGETESFESWMKRHQEITTIRQELQTEEEHLLVPVEKSVADGVALSNEVKEVLSKRDGQVLAQQTILKHDAFPGCQKVNLKEKVGGAYNFRRVEVKQVKHAVKYGAIKSGLEEDMRRDDESVVTAPFICGCAMPSKDAIKAVLKRLNAGPGGKRRVLWTCLREEPVLYINKEPYVLRLHHDPIKNLETTGIARERVEGMEDRMKLDVLAELKHYEGRLLLHGEETAEKGGFILVPVWETVPEANVETPSQVFQSIIDEGYQVDYLRIPITDEQAPIPDVFDQLIRRVQYANAGVDVLFNCQMGRGRTTTGMVTASLMTMILKNDSIVDMQSSYIVDSSSDLYASSDSSTQGIHNDNDELHEERKRYQNGEYKIVLQLVSVLTYGKLAKRLTDQAINICDHMQNLRKAVYDYKLRVEAIEDRGSKKYKETREVALNYLVRYAYLIVFANYLLEEMGNLSLNSSVHSSVISSTDEETDVSSSPEPDTIVGEDAQKMTTFKEWLKGRRELTNIIRLQSFDLS
ncbi:inositol hexakisphosphate-domain-containing protein [Fennellomyces sp. T-0311]|nr:inositol hexakisphosphate-domain-containing protein [Fennellomyces sp. T-0311]